MRLQASQLSLPRGPLGLVVGRELNKHNRPVTSAAVDAAAPRPGESVADLGFGGGVGLEILLQRVGGRGHVHGVDLSETMVRAARRRFRSEVSAGRLVVQEGSLLSLPLADDLLDAAITQNTVYFVDDLPGVFGEVQRVVKPGGRFVVAIGDPDFMATYPFTRHGFRLRPVAEVKEHLAEAGLVEEDHRRIGDGDDAAHLLVWGTPPAVVKSGPV